ncbi:hypothetical protein HRbin08_02050 [bacterium HR08]|nr:hypothetical protein HRbin08_02050 [bacterium HR08]
MVAARKAACCAAKGVPLREPLKPKVPPLAHTSVFPSRSVTVTIVLLNVDLMCTIPCGTIRFSLFFAPRRLAPFAMVVSP